MESDDSLPHSQDPPTVPILSQLDPVHTSTSHILKMHLNKFLPFTSGSPKWSFPPGSPTKTLYMPLLSHIHASCPAHLILLNFINLTILGEGYKSLRASLCNFLHSPVSTSLSDQKFLRVCVCVCVCVCVYVCECACVCVFFCNI